MAFSPMAKYTHYISLLRPFGNRLTQVPDSDAAYDLGPFWYEGRTPDGVTFWFRKRNPNQLSEFEVSWNHPEAGNATGSGTVGGARVIGIGELERCTDIAGRAKVSAN
jgi:hypothetical protein